MMKFQGSIYKCNFCGYQTTVLPYQKVPRTCPMCQGNKPMSWPAEETDG